MEERQTIAHEIQRLLSSQKLAVLATTQEDAVPYANLIAFAHNGRKLTEIYFVTLAATRKYRNLKARPQVALVMDERTGAGLDFGSASALTVLGKAGEMSGLARDEALAIYRTANPELKDLTADPGCALFRVKVRRYILVSGLRQVTEFDPDHNSRTD